MVTLVACAHGTRDSVGREAIAGLVEGVRSRLQVRVVDAFVDVQSPTPDDVVAALGGSSAVLVPILLSAGYHVHVDLARAASSGPDVRVARALGPDPRLAALLERRLRESGLRGDDTVILAAAGSSDARAVADVEAVATALGERIGRPVLAAYSSASRPSIPEAVASARAAMGAGAGPGGEGGPGGGEAGPGGGEAGVGGRVAGEGGRVVVALYLLAPGHFADRAAACGADVVTRTLLVPGQDPPSELVDIVLDRFAALPSPNPP